MINISNWKKPTPPKFKKVIRFSLIMAAGAGALLMADSLGKAIIPGFEYKLHPYTLTVCKNIVVFGIVAAALAKATKETEKLEDVDKKVDDVKSDVAAIKEKTDQL